MDPDATWGPLLVVTAAGLLIASVYVLHEVFAWVAQQDRGWSRGRLCVWLAVGFVAVAVLTQRVDNAMTRADVALFREVQQAWEMAVTETDIDQTLKIAVLEHRLNGEDVLRVPIWDGRVRPKPR